MKEAWERVPVEYTPLGAVGGNYIMSNEDVMVSYQPWDKPDDFILNDMVDAMTGDDSRAIPETALHNKLTDEWLILKGDHRKAYEKAFPNLNECLIVS